MELTSIAFNPVTAPVDAVITLNEAKKQLRIETDFNEEDDLIQAYINSSIDAAEEYLSGHIYAKQVTMMLSKLCEAITFEVYPVRSITSIEYYKQDEDVLTQMDASNYYLRNLNLRVQQVVIKELPDDIAERPDAVKIILESGYEGSDSIPDSIKQAVKLNVSDFYNYREDRKEIINKVSHQLLRPFRSYT